MFTSDSAEHQVWDVSETCGLISEPTFHIRESES